MRRFLAPVVGLVVLWALWLPTAEGARQRLALDWRPSTILALLIAVLAALALAQWRLPRAIRALLAFLLFAAALLQLVATLVLSFLDRPLDLYFDPAQLPSLFGLFRDAIGGLGAALVCVAAVVGAILLVVAIYAALGSVAAALQPRCRSWAGLGLALAALLLATVPGGPVSAGAGTAIADQGARFYHAWAVVHGQDRRYRAALATPEPPLRDLTGLAGHDVLLIFVESYGTVALDDPRYRAVVTPALAAFAETVETAGYALASSRLISPTFGGGSWLAHGTLASGLKLDPFLNRLVLASARKSLPRYLAASGYRTVAVMPGIKKPAPEAAFWGFDKNYYARDLAYPGPSFGWFGIPDQYTLKTFAEHELGPGHKPLFAQIVLVSSHTPFSPLPPYVADWRDTAHFAAVSPAQWQAIFRAPDWAHLDEPYLDSLVYDLRVLGAWLARRDGAPLVIILGDHQPPGFVSGSAAPWTVPVHVLSRDPALVAPFLRRGYVAGALPPPEAAPEGMESFLGEFLADFSAASATRRASE